MKPQFLEMIIFCRPGNLYWDRRRASRAMARSALLCQRLARIATKKKKKIQFIPGLLTGVTSADAHDDLTDVDTGNGSVGLAPGTTHTSLQSIGTGARQHLVDTDDVVGVSANAEVETFLSGKLDEVLVGADTGGLEGLGAQLLILVGDEVDAEREVVDGRALSAKIEDADLGVRDTTVEAGLGIRLDNILSVKFLYSS